MIEMELWWVNDNLFLMILPAASDNETQKSEPCDAGWRTAGNDAHLVGPSIACFSLSRTMFSYILRKASDDDLIAFIEAMDMNVIRTLHMELAKILLTI